MQLTREQIENIAHLARLALQPAELAVYQQSLSAIFDFVGDTLMLRESNDQLHLPDQIKRHKMGREHRLPLSRRR